MSWTSERARHAALIRHQPDNTVAIGEARRDLRAERLAEFIRQTVDAAPPLTEAQRTRLAALLRGSGAGDG